MQRKDRAWQAPELSKQYLKNVRGAIPLAKEQIEVMMRVIGSFLPEVGNFLDIGCGDGVLASAIRKRYPKARATLLDFSGTMLKEARKRLKPERRGGRTHFIEADFGESGWTGSVREKAPFDVIVSWYAIHHQPDSIKKRLYREVFRLLKPGGVFINIEHVSSPTARLSAAFDDVFVDSLYAFSRKAGLDAGRAEVADKYYSRQDKAANILALVETQCAWLEYIGFEDVDCCFKIFELAVFGGRRPERRPL